MYSKGVVRCLAVFLSITSFIQACSARQRCCADNVCFDDNPPFDGLPLPACPENIGITLTLYTRTNPQQGQPVTRTNIPAVYDGSKLTMFVTHGFFGSKNNLWMLDIMDDVLRVEDCNVVVVGWGGGSITVRYDEAASDTRAVGAEIGLVAAHLVSAGGSAQARLYCVGHSLGSHVCGHAGMKFKFGRITGLDAAGPLFDSRDSLAGLNPTSADLVEVIHTGGHGSIALNFGTMKRLGHVDFYPNGGGSQSECIADPFLQDITEQFGLDQLIRGPTVLMHVMQSVRTTASDVLPVCSHFSAVRFFKESIKTPCFLSRQLCTDQLNLPGSCSGSMYTDTLQTMGFRSNQFAGKGIFYLHTNAEAPFCNN
jgi:hypothetical protein